MFLFALRYILLSLMEFICVYCQQKYRQWSPFLYWPGFDDKTPLIPFSLYLYVQYLTYTEVVLLLPKLKTTML
jgi:hypothetical protein